MKPKHVVLSLPVSNYEESQRFYQALGLKVENVAEDLLSIELPGLTLFLAEAKNFEQFSQIADLKAALNEDNAECFLSCAIEAQVEVDETLEKARQAGGTAYEPVARDHFGRRQYVGYFKDPDGHLWELVCNLTPTDSS